MYRAPQSTSLLQELQTLLQEEYVRKDQVNDENSATNDSPTSGASKDKHAKPVRVTCNSDDAHKVAYTCVIVPLVMSPTEEAG